MMKTYEQFNESRKSETAPGNYTWIPDKYLTTDIKPDYRPKKLLFEKNKTKKELKEEQQKKDEKRYLSQNERERLKDYQRKYLVNKRKEEGSDAEIKESLRDKMKGKSYDDIEANLKKLNIFFRDDYISNYDLPNKFRPSINDYLDYLGIKDDHIVNKNDFADTELEKSLEELIKILGSKYGEIKLYDSESDSSIYDSIDNFLNKYVDKDKAEYLTINDNDFLVYKDQQVVFLLPEIGEPYALLFDINLGRNLQESLVDKMTPKSEEEITNKLKDNNFHFKKDIISVRVSNDWFDEPLIKDLNLTIEENSKNSMKLIGKPEVIFTAIKRLFYTSYKNTIKYIDRNIIRDKYKNKIKESLVDKMVPKSKEEILYAVGMDKDLDKKYMNIMFPQMKKELEEKFEDIKFHREETVYSTTYYITDKYDDEENLYEIQKILNEYGTIFITSNFKGHSALKVRIKK